MYLRSKIQNEPFPYIINKNKENSNNNNNNNSRKRCCILAFDPAKNAIQGDAPEGSDTF